MSNDDEKISMELTHGEINILFTSLLGNKTHTESIGLWVTPKEGEMLKKILNLKIQYDKKVLEEIIKKEKEFFGNII